jgi:homoserine/homoserine lactone efflux protein
VILKLGIARIAFDQGNKRVERGIELQVVEMLKCGVNRLPVRHAASQTNQQNSVERLHSIILRKHASIALTFDTWFLFFITEAVLSLTPGLAVLYVISQGLRGGAKTAVWSACGILTANFLYFVLSATSVGAVLAASERLFLVVKYAGAAYLIYLGLRSLLGKAGPLVTRMAAPDPPHRIYTRGVAIQLANPKTLLFFTAIVPQFVNPRTAIGPQMVILAATSIIPEFFILMGYGALAGRASEWARQPKYATWADRLAGALLLLVGAGLALMKRG